MGKPIKILYDDGGFRETHGGVSRYFTEMMKHLPCGYEWQLGMTSTVNYYLQQPPFNLPRHKQTVHDFIRDTLHGYSFPGVSLVYKALARIFPQRFPSGELANAYALADAYKKGDYDILHLTHPHPVRNTWRHLVGRKPIVVTVHDLIPEMIQGNAMVAACRRHLLDDATHIIAVSENTKHDIMQFYGLPDEKITVIYHGHISKQYETGELPKVVEKPYLLYVGKRSGYKNFEPFLKAVAPLMRRNGLMLFCTGAPLTDIEKTLIEALGIKDLVMQRFVSDADMQSLFANAVAFVYPSRYEGFGIPILDAFDAGCPVVLPRCSCFPEVAGDAALYYENGNVLDLCSVLDCLLESVKLREDMIARGRNRVGLFSWELCAIKTSRVYSKIMEGMTI